MDNPKDRKGNLTDEELNDIYAWVDNFNLSRPKKNIARDFSDGLLVAEMVKHNFPKQVETHNYPASHNVKQKVTNWGTLNRKVFGRMGFAVQKSDIEDITNCKQYAIEKLLMILQVKIDKYRDNYKEDTTVHQDQQTGYTNQGNDMSSYMGSLNNSNNMGGSYGNQNNIADNYPPLSPAGGMYPNDQMLIPNQYNQMNNMGGMIQTNNQGPNVKRGDYPPKNPSNNSRNRSNNTMIQAGRNNLQMNPNMNSPGNVYPGNTKQNPYGNKTPSSGYDQGNMGFTQTTSNSRTNNNANYMNNQNNPGKYKGMSIKDLEQVIVERDNVILDLKDTVEILELKIKKMEQQLALKDGKINNLMAKMGK